jgi:predicted secreted protein
MNWFSGIVVYIIVWWLVFFMMLPLGVRSARESGVDPGDGNDPGAPARPRIGLKALAATGIAALLWAGIYWIIVSDIITFRGG